MILGVFAKGAVNTQYKQRIKNKFRRKLEGLAEALYPKPERIIGIYCLCIYS
jgi:hypothetical protein